MSSLSFSYSRGKGSDYALTCQLQLPGVQLPGNSLVCDLAPGAGEPAWELERKALRVCAWFEQQEEIARQAGFEEWEAYRYSFSDLAFTPTGRSKESNIMDPYAFLGCIQNMDLHADLKIYAAVIILRGVYAYLKNDERYQAFRAHLLCLFCAWQWYSLVKWKTQNEPALSEMHWVNEMAQAYREYIYCSMLPEMEKYYTVEKLLNLDKSFIETQDATYRFLLQSVMLQNNPPFMLEPTDERPRLIDPPELYAHKINWQGYKQQMILHPVFMPASTVKRKSIPQATAVIRFLATEVALNRYDFETTLHLANMLRGRKPGCKLPLWLGLVLLATLVLGIAIIAATALVKTQKSFEQASLGLYLGGGLVFVLGAMVFLGIVAAYFDLRLFWHLLLPRFLGGIFIGFSITSLQGDVTLLTQVIWSWNGLPVLLMWAAVVLICGAYIYSDIHPRVNSEREVWNRVIQSLVIFSLLTLVAGLFIVAFTTAAFWESLPYKQAGDFIFGPIGWVNIQLWLFLSPLALLLGTVTQFIFEDNTITASVWPIEKD